MDNVIFDSDALHNYTTNYTLLPLYNSTTFSDETYGILDDTENPSSDAEPLLEFLFHGVGLLLICIFGIPANVLSIIVLQHPRLKSSLNTLLLGLTISDTVVISTSFFVFSLSELLKLAGVFSWYVDVGRQLLLPWLLPIALTAQMCSMYFTVVITLERYVAVCLPLHARSICTRSAAKWSSFVIVMFAVVYNIPRWFEFKAVATVDNGTIKYEEVETDFRKTVFFITYYVHWAYFVFMYAIPFTIILYFNYTIYEKTREHRSIRESLRPGMTNQPSTSMSAEDFQLAFMLFGIVLSFIACNALAVVINLMESLGKEDLIGNMIPISNFLLALACSTNWVFYCIFGTEFRRCLKGTLPFGRCRHNSDFSTSTRSEAWSERDSGSICKRNHRLESLQRASLPRSRSGSNPHCSGHACENGSDVKDTRRVTEDGSIVSEAVNLGSPKQDMDKDNPSTVVTIGSDGA